MPQKRDKITKKPVKTQLKQVFWPANKERRLVRLGLYGVIMCVICGVGFYAISLPWNGTADSRHHLDYAWQVSRGQLPKFKKGIRAPFPDRAKSPLQYTAQHPPLYYALNAPFVGPLMNGKHIEAAVAVTRIINIMIAIGCVLAFAWAGWLFGGKRRALFAIAVPSILTSIIIFVKIAGDTMNDVINILFVSLALILASQILKKGLVRNYLLLLGLVCVLGMAARASFISTLGLSALAVAVAGYVHSKPSKQRKRGLGKGMGIAAIIVIIALGASSWFYMRNYRASGSPLRSAKYGTIGRLQKRGYKSFHKVISSRELWLGLPAGLFGNPWFFWPTIGSRPINTNVSLTFFTLLMVSAVVWAYQQRLWQKIRGPNALIVGLLSLHFVFIIVQQVMYARGFGAINPRYIMPIWLPLGLVLAAGALAWPKLRGLGVVLFAGVGWLAVIVNSMWFSTFRYPSGASNSWQELVYDVTQRNGLPFGLIPLLIVGVIVGLGLQATAFWQLTRKTKT